MTEVVPTQCYKCKKVLDENNNWILLNGKTEHINLANHTVCPICLKNTQRELSIQNIFKEYSERIKTFFKNKNIFLISNNNSLKTKILSKFSTTGIKLVLYEKNFINKVIEFCNENNDSLNLIIYDVEFVDEFEKLSDIIDDKKLLLVILDRKNIKYYFKYFQNSNNDFIFNDFIVEEFIYSFFKILNIKQLKKNDDVIIKDLKKSKLDLLSKIMFMEDSNDTGYVDQLKQENEKLEIKVKQMKKMLNEKNFQLMEYSEKFAEADTKNMLLGTYNFNYLLLILNDIVKKVSVLHKKMFLTQLNIDFSLSFMLKQEEFLSNAVKDIKSLSSFFEELIKKNIIPISISVNKIIFIYFEDEKCVEKIKEKTNFLLENYGGEIKTKIIVDEIKKINIIKGILDYII